MAEITEPLIAAAQHLDPDLMRNTKPGLNRLILTVLVLFCFILGQSLSLTPKFTASFFHRRLSFDIQIRRDLPRAVTFLEIDSLSADLAAAPLRFPCRFQAILVGFSSDSDVTSLESSISHRITELTRHHAPPCDRCDHSVSVFLRTRDHALLDGVDFSAADEAVDEAMEAALRSGFGYGDGGGEVYRVVVVKSDVEEIRGVVGKYRNAWIFGGVSEEEEAVAKAAEVFVKVFMNGGKEEEELVRGEFMPVGADGTLVLSFNLLNAEPLIGFTIGTFRE